MILSKINRRWKLILGVIGLLALLLGSTAPVSAAKIVQHGTTNSSISFHNLNPKDPMLPVDSEADTPVTHNKTKTRPAATSVTEPEATKASVTLPSKGTGSTKLPQTSSASVSMITLLSTLTLSSALSIAIIGKYAKAKQ